MEMQKLFNMPVTRYAIAEGPVGSSHDDNRQHICVVEHNGFAIPGTLNAGITSYGSSNIIVYF